MRNERKLDLKSLTLGVLLGAIATISSVIATKPAQLESWQYQTAPRDVFQRKIKEQINQAIREGWTLARSETASTSEAAPSKPRARSVETALREAEG